MTYSKTLHDLSYATGLLAVVTMLLTATLLNNKLVGIISVAVTMICLLVCITEYILLKISKRNQGVNNDK